MDLKIEVESFDNLLAPKIMGSPATLSIGDYIPLPGGAILTYKNEDFQKSMTELPRAVEFLLTLGTGVVIDLVANWLYDRLKGKSRITVKINRKEVNLDDSGHIRRILTEYIEKTE